MPRYGQRVERWVERPRQQTNQQIYIKDVKSSNGTFVNGERLSAEGLESEAWELKSDDTVVSRWPQSKRRVI